MWVQIKVTIFNAMFALFLFGGLWLNRNFLKYVFEKTFHYSKEGWDKVHLELRLVLRLHRVRQRVRAPYLP
jgi:intracellular septation protein A